MPQCYPYNGRKQVKISDWKTGQYHIAEAICIVDYGCGAMEHDPMYIRSPATRSWYRIRSYENSISDIYFVVGIVENQELARILDGYSDTPPGGRREAV